MLEAGVNNTHGFLYDIMVGGMVEEWLTLWGNAKRMFYILVVRGFYLNLQKCSFFEMNVVIISIELICQGGY